jgi:RNA polymerase sigma factor (sigma-70 family)
METQVIKYQQTGRDRDFAPIFEGLRGLIGVLVRDKHGTADDLFQEGCIGLVDAARTFDPSRGVPFKAYARKRIRWAISKAERIEARNAGREAYEETGTVEPEHVANQLDAVILAETLDGLTEQERAIVLLHAAGHTFEAIGAKLGLTTETTRRKAKKVSL